MSRAVSHFEATHARHSRLSEAGPAPRQSALKLRCWSGSGRDGGMPPAAPAARIEDGTAIQESPAEPLPKGARPPKDVLLARLGAEIATRERRAGIARPWVNPSAEGEPSRDCAFWGFGEDGIDSRLAGGLDLAGVHEIGAAPSLSAVSASGRSSAAARAAAFHVALCLAIRRLDLLAGTGRDGERPVLMCATDAVLAELGRPYGPGLLWLGLAPRRLILVEARRAADVLAAMEEGLRSAATALVLGLLDGVEATPARRLSLAAEAGATPCLLLTGPRHGGTIAAGTRWRAAPAPSAPHPFDPQAPGAPRVALGLDRCRLGAVRGDLPSRVLEWCHEAHRFRVAAAVADRAHAPPHGSSPARLGAG